MNGMSYSIENIVKIQLRWETHPDIEIYDSELAVNTIMKIYNSEHELTLK